MFALCDFSDVTINVKFKNLSDGTNMFRNTGLKSIGEIEINGLQQGGGMFGGCSLDSSSALKVIAAAKKSGARKLENCVTIGVSGSLMGDKSFRSAAGLPDEVPDDAASKGEYAYFNDDETEGVAIFWN